MIETARRCTKWISGLTPCDPGPGRKGRRTVMGDLVNLNKYRKSRQRQSESRQAAINREKFGKSKAEAARETARRTQEEKALDEKKLDRTVDEE